MVTSNDTGLRIYNAIETSKIIYIFGKVVSTNCIQIIHSIHIVKYFCACKWRNYFSPIKSRISNISLSLDLMVEYRNKSKNEKNNYFGVHSSGLRPSGLKIFQDHLIYPLGDKISIVNLRTHKQQLLGGHSNTVSALDISRW